MRPFWRAVLGYRELGDEDLVDPHGRGPSVWFQEMDAPRPQRNRIHVDISVPHDQAEARVAAALATWMGRDHRGRFLRGVRPALAVDDRGEHELKGVPGTWRLLAVALSR